MLVGLRVVEARLHFPAFLANGDEGVTSDELFLNCTALSASREGGSAKPAELPLLVMGAALHLSLGRQEFISCLADQ